ncbi:hypothetical protein AB5I41_26035 [Sphingomonas sp. MMS24-JH45]
MVTVVGGKETLTATRMPGSDLLRLSGTIPTGAETMRLGVDDPAHRAAWQTGAIAARTGRAGDGGVQYAARTGRRSRRARADPGGAAARGAGAGAAPYPPPLAEDLRVTNKVSQNLHADLLLRRAGAVGDGIGRGRPCRARRDAGAGGCPAGSTTSPTDRACRATTA